MKLCRVELRRRAKSFWIRFGVTKDYDRVTIRLSWHRNFGGNLIIFLRNKRIVTL